MSRVYKGHGGVRIEEKKIDTVTYDADTGCFYICMKDKPCNDETMLLLCRHKKDHQAFGEYFRKHHLNTTK